MIKLIECWENPVPGCQEVRIGDICRPSYFMEMREGESDPSCTVHKIDTVKMELVLRTNFENYYYIIRKDQLKRKYGFFGKL
jgi:hypothetical protein